MDAPIARIPHAFRTRPRVPSYVVFIALRRIATHCVAADRDIAIELSLEDRRRSEEVANVRRRLFSFFFFFFSKLAAVSREAEGERKREEIDAEYRQRDFVGGCDESKSGSHWTELRKSVDPRRRIAEKRKKEVEEEEEKEKEVVAALAADDDGGGCTVADLSGGGGEEKNENERERASERARMMKGEKEERARRS